jgi:hypothetical protein
VVVFKWEVIHLHLDSAAASLERWGVKHGSAASTHRAGIAWVDKFGSPQCSVGQNLALS